MSKFRVFVPLLLALGLIASVACGGSDNKGSSSSGGSSSTSGGSGGGNAGTVNVMGIWGGEELDSFNAMTKGWNGKVNFTGTRDITAILNQRVQGGNPPDVAIPAEVGLFRQFVADGKVTPLSKCPGLEEQVKAQYPQSFLDLGTVNGQLYGFFMKADSKATIWYNPAYFQQKNLQPLTESASFNDLVALANKVKDSGVPPFSIGQEAGAGSGYPGSDVIQQILLNDAGAQTYDAIVNGTMPFNSQKMKDAWTKFGQMVNTPGFVSQGNAAGVNATNFQDAAYPPFQSPPKAGMVPLGGFTAGFISKQFPSLKAGTDYDFMPWPGGGVTGGANIVYAFNANPATCSFMSYLASPDAQTVWVKRGGFTSVNKNVDQSAYPDAVSKKLAQELTNSKTFRFDLDDAIGGATQQAEFKGVTQFLQNPSQLDAILAGIQATMPKR